MKITAETQTARTSPSLIAWGHFVDYFELTKPRITSLVLVTTFVGFSAAGSGVASLSKLILTLLGTGLVAGGSSAWNMYLERDLDAQMLRTSLRPLPGGRLRPSLALAFALLISGLGLMLLFVGANPLAALLAAITEGAYIAFYTPLKTRTWWCTLVGAGPGALPVLIGWAAASANLQPKAWALFAIIFFWQMPHFFAIGWLYREDYARAGFRILPVVDAAGNRTSRQVQLFSLLLGGAALAPFVLALAGFLYISGAFVLTVAFIALAFHFARLRSSAAANRLFLYSIVYLPLLFFLLILDRR
jgi:heme o synthase